MPTVTRFIYFYSNIISGKGHKPLTLTILLWRATFHVSLCTKQETQLPQTYHLSSAMVKCYTTVRRSLGVTRKWHHSRAS